MSENENSRYGEGGPDRAGDRPGPASGLSDHRLPPNPSPHALPHSLPHALPKPVPGGWRALGRADVERLHALYYDPDLPVARVAEQFGIATSSLLRWIAEMGWPSRRQMRRQSCEALRSFGRDLRRGLTPRDDRMEPPAAAVRYREPEPEPAYQPAFPAPIDVPAAGAQPVDPARLAGDIEQALQREIVFVQGRLNDPSPVASERNARTLVHLVKALAQLQDLRRGAAAGGGRGAQHPPAFAGEGAGYPAPEERPARSLAELRDDLARRLEIIRADDAANNRGG